MELTIYPLGDSAFIERILNAVAIYTSQAGFAATVATAALLGVFATAIQSMMKGGKEIDVASIFIGIGAFILLFDTVTTRVIIEDRVTGGVRVVDNVPAGVSVPAYLISNIGNNISSGFESIYTSVSTTNQTPMTAGGSYADSLQALVNLRTRAYSADMMSAANKAMGGAQADFRKSVYNYIKECTLPKFDLGLANQQDLKNLGLTEAIRFESQVYFTEIYQAGGPSEMTCSQAWSALDNVFTNLFNEDEVNRVLNKALQATSTAPGAPTWQDKLNISNSELLAGLGGGGLAAQQMALTMIVEPIMLEAAQGKYQDFQDQTLAIAMTNAIEQRNISWAAQASFFQETIYPMMTFFEGLSFAITPFIAFLMVMGAFGIKLGIKYFMLLIWIQLWMPLLSIVDLFITEGASSELALAGSSVTTANSIYFMNAAYDTAKTWIGTGSYMATAVPMISLFLVSGSMYGAASLANSISSSTAKGADAAAESIQPDAFNMGALNSLGSASNTSFGTGQTTLDGRGGEISKVNLSSAASESTRAAAQNVESKTDQFGAQFSDSLTNNTSSGDNVKSANAYARAAQASQSSIYTAANEQVMGLTEGYTDNKSTIDTLSGVVAGSISGSLSTPAALQAAKAAIKADGTMSEEDKNQLTQSVSETIQEGESSKFSEQDKSEFGTSVASNYQYAQEEVFGTGEQSQQQAGLSYASQEVEQASRSYEDAQAFEQRMGANREFDSNVLANYMDGSEVRDITSGFSQEDQTKFSDRQDVLQDAGITPQQAYKVAALEVGMESADADTRQAAMNSIAEVTGFSVGQSEIGTQETGGFKTNNVDSSKIGEGAATLRNPDNAPTLDTSEGTMFEQLVGAEGYDNALGIMESRAENQVEVSTKAMDSAKDDINNYGNQVRDSFSAFSLNGIDDTFEAGVINDVMSAGDGAYEGFRVLGENIANATGEAAEGYNSIVSNAYENAENTEGGIGDKMGAFFSSIGEQFGETTSGLANDIGASFEQGMEAGMQEYQDKRDDLQDWISSNIQETSGLNEAQGDFFAASQMAYLDMAMGVDMGNERFQEARDEFISQYEPEHGSEFANNLANTITMAASNSEYGASQLASVSGFNIADEAHAQSQSTLDQLNGLGGASAPSSPMSPEFTETMENINEQLEEVALAMERVGIQIDGERD